MTDPRIDALQAAVAADPTNVALVGLLADLLVDAGRVDEAVTLQAGLLAAGDLGPEDALVLTRRALDVDRLDVARGALEVARGGGLVEGLAELEASLQQAIARRGVALDAGPDTAPSLAEEVGLTFAEVGGMDDVKKLLHRMIILPFVRPELYAKYNRSAGGGVLLYGPPGCGKTLLARAIAGECGLPFFSVGIDDVVSPFQGQAELNVSEIFAQARDLRPAVVFIDEIDAIGYARQRAQGEMGRRLTNALLQELDGVGRSTEGLLVLAASNAPWDVDSALLRPGRFDRRVFVPPPDEAAREAILDVRLRGVETSGVDLRALARATELFTGADLRATVERALDDVIETVLDTGEEIPVGQQHLTSALAQVTPSALDWLARARDYVEFSNASGQWADVESYLGQRAVRRRLTGR
ncbi:MAG: AAA family ATPase [Aeromicrobium erythreum]